MRVVLDRSLFEDDTVHQTQLLALFELARNERHLLLCDPAFDADSTDPANVWMDQQPPRIRLEVAAILTACLDAQAALPATQSTIRVTAVETRWSERIVDLGAGSRLLNEPLHVLLEDDNSDLAFLFRMAPPLQRRRLQHALDNGWAVADHGGGLGKMTSHVESLIEDPSESARIKRLRHWVLFDRDSDPADRSRPSADSERLREMADQVCDGDPWGIASHQLGRRSIENYLPLKALDSWAAGAGGRIRKRRYESVGAFGRLRQNHPDCAWQYNMKRGLLQDAPDQRRRLIRERLSSIPRDRLLPRQVGAAFELGDLDPSYRTLDPEDRGALTFGFGRDIADLYGDEHWVWEADFEREYEHGPPGQPRRAEVLDSLLERM